MFERLETCHYGVAGGRRAVVSTSLRKYTGDVQSSRITCEVKTKIVRSGSARGVQLPEPLLEEAGLRDEVELRLVETGILLEGARSPRAGWADAAALIRSRGEDGLLDEPTPTDFDDSEWE